MDGFGAGFFVGVAGCDLSADSAAGVVVSLPAANGPDEAAAGALALSAATLLVAAPVVGSFLDATGADEVAAVPSGAEEEGDAEGGAVEIGFAGAGASDADAAEAAGTEASTAVAGGVDLPDCPLISAGFTSVASFSAAVAAFTPPAPAAATAPAEAAATAAAFSPPSVFLSAAVVKPPDSAVTLAAKPLFVTGITGAPSVALLATATAAFAFSVDAAAGSVMAPPCGSTREAKEPLSPFIACACVSLISLSVTGRVSGFPRRMSAPVTVATALAMTGRATCEAVVIELGT